MNDINRNFFRIGIKIFSYYKNLIKISFLVSDIFIKLKIIKILINNQLILLNKKIILNIKKKNYFILYKLKNNSNNINIFIQQYKYIKIGNYVKVDKDIIWVTPEIWEQIQVYSNTNWIIK